MRILRAYNIGEIGSRRRAWLGAALLVGGLAAALLIDLYGRPRWWLVPLFFLFWAGALGLLQAQARTCVLLAVMGVRETRGGLEREADHEVLRRVRRRSIAVLAESAALGALVTISAALLFR